jgi:threonine synthase
MVRMSNRGIDVVTHGRRDYRIRCAECSTEAVSMPSYDCRVCGGPLVVDAAAVTRDDLVGDRNVRGVWRHAGLLPATRSAVTLGEASTPILPLKADSMETREARVYGKLESLNPTLSFKDRGMALAASVAIDLGLEGLSLASTGNAAVSAAAYAAAAGLPCRIVCATGSRASIKLAAASAYGAEVELVDGDYSDAYARARAVEREGWFNVTTTYRNPLLAEGYRGMALEIVEQLGGSPDVVVVPVGAGPLLRALYLGFQDLRAVGMIEQPPRLVGVQTEACAPLARAWPRKDWLTSLLDPSPALPTGAGAIADSLRGYEREGLLTLEAARTSGGVVIAVSEAEIQEAKNELARQGLLLEPAAAAALAALRSRRLEELTPAGGSVVLILTGHGVKEQLWPPHQVNTEPR